MRGAYCTRGRLWVVDEPPSSRGSQTRRRRLLAVYDQIAQRADRTAATHLWWPCRRGCDTCCRRLAEVPRLTRDEWTLLREGIDALEPARRAEVEARVAALDPPRDGHVVCPLLDDAEGACLVYAHRPAACRTYGFYVDRGSVLGCEQLVTAVTESGEHDAIVWGNEASVRDATARVLGEERSLTSWWRDQGPQRD